MVMPVNKSPRHGSAKTAYLRYCTLGAKQVLGAAKQKSGPPCELTRAPRGSQAAKPPCQRRCSSALTFLHFHPRPQTLISVPSPRGYRHARIGFAHPSTRGGTGEKQKRCRLCLEGPLAIVRLVPFAPRAVVPLAIVLLVRRCGGHGSAPTCCHIASTVGGPIS